MNIGIIGMGTLGLALAEYLTANPTCNMRLVGICGRENAENISFTRARGIPNMDMENLIHCADCIVEATTASSMPAIVRLVVQKGKIILPMSVGGFAFDTDLLDFLERHQANVLIPSGGISGIDGLLALREIGLDWVKITTTKSPKSLAGAPFFASSNSNPADLEEATVIFEGSARQSILAFPANTNLAITVSLAGIGFDKTCITIIADPKTNKTTQYLEAHAGECSIETYVRGVPLMKNPRTAQMALESLKALLRKTTSTVHLGT